MVQVTTVEITQALNNIKRDNPEPVFTESLSVFLKLIINIISSPHDERFKVIKKNNKTIAEKWVPCHGIEDLARLVGYESNDDTNLVFSGEVESLSLLKTTIEAVISEEAKKNSARMPVPSNQGSQSRLDNQGQSDSSKSLPKSTPEPPIKTKEPKTKTKEPETKIKEPEAIANKEEAKKAPEAAKPPTKKPIEIKPVANTEPDYKLEWSGSSYSGPIKDGWFEGRGRFRFPSGVVYEGDFHKGEFHGKGTLIFPNGGKYKASWNRGKAVDGEYEYYDGLIYDSQNWNYCQIPDRRFYTEIKEGLRPAGATLIVNDPKGPKAMVPGTYDVGEGYYDMNKNMIYNYEEEELGPPEDSDLRDILEKYRYNPANL